MMQPAVKNIPIVIRSLADVAGRYDGFILDLWGVVHDGVKPYPDTIETLAMMKRGGKKVWMLSNAPRRAAAVAEKLEEMNITPELYDGIMTSGEATWHSLRDNIIPKFGNRCFHIGPPLNSSLYKGLDIRMVKDVKSADFILNSGVYDFDDTAEKYMSVLKECFKEDLPMICANPDKIVHVGDKLVICAGTTAAMYEKLGGNVSYFGKPHRAVYSLVLKDIGVKKILAVGDSMETDIAGATAAGLDSVLISSGIHKDALTPEPHVIIENHLQSFLAKYPWKPSFVTRVFSW